jgi:hypothetical protein
MRKIINHQVWIMILTGVLLFSCDRDPDPFTNGPGHRDEVTGLNDSEIASIQGEWTVIHASLKKVKDSRVLSEYFKDFRVSISHEVSLCCINGCETWRAVREWKNYSNVFESLQDRNTMRFDILNVSRAESNMTVIIQKEEPGFTFLPGKWKTGDFILILMRDY